MKLYNLYNYNQKVIFFIEENLLIFNNSLTEKHFDMTKSLVFVVCFFFVSGAIFVYIHPILYNANSDIISVFKLETCHIVLVALDSEDGDLMEMETSN